MTTKQREDKSGKLFDTLMEENNLKNDARLAKFLDLPPPVVSKIRNGRMPIGATLIIAVHEITGMQISEIKHLIAS